jgi:transposase/predicted RNA-binding Zn-ribbon protein involved in translation (DUF1610 family)
MVHVKYTREVLAAAVAGSTTMAGVLRHLGLRPSGGAHTHLRRRINDLGLDTSHFLGQAHLRGTRNARRKTPGEVLIARGELDRRARPHELTRALREIGRPYQCAGCGVGDTWNGRPLTLHVDHIDGRFWDSRPDNLRFLCPNCHTQTPTFAGRNRAGSPIPLVRVDAEGNPVVIGHRGALSEAEQAEVLTRLDDGQLTLTDAARLIGRHRNTVYQIRRRLAERGSPAPLKPRAHTSAADRAAVIAYALANPSLGPKRLCAELRSRQCDALTVSHGTISTILSEAGLNTVAARRAAATASRAVEGRLD